MGELLYWEVTELKTCFLKELILVSSSVECHLMFCLSHFQFLWNYIKLVKVIFELASFDFILLYFM